MPLCRIAGYIDLQLSISLLFSYVFSLSFLAFEWIWFVFFLFSLLSRGPCYLYYRTWPALLADFWDCMLSSVCADRSVTFCSVFVISNSRPNYVDTKSMGRGRGCSFILQDISGILIADPGLISTDHLSSFNHVIALVISIYSADLILYFGLQTLVRCV